MVGRGQEHAGVRGPEQVVHPPRLVPQLGRQPIGNRTARLALLARVCRLGEHVQRRAQLGDADARLGSLMRGAFG
jgi:hypothetical protein